MPPNVADTFIMLKPRKEWPDPSMAKGELVEEIEELVEGVPGNNYEFTQPIQMRFNELISGVRSDVGVKIFGDDLDMLLQVAGQVQAVVQGVQGAADVKTEQVSGLPVLTVKLNRPALARLGISVADVQSIVEIAVGGKKAGLIFEGDRRFDIVVRLPEHLRSDIEAIRNLPIPLPPAEAPGTPVKALWRQLAAVAGALRTAVIGRGNRIAPGPNQISRENGKRRIVVTANVRGRDLGSFVADAQAPGHAEGEAAARLLDRLGRPVRAAGLRHQAPDHRGAGRAAADLPAAVHEPWLGWPTQLLVFSGVPLALTGGVAALLLRGMPLSISAGVGFIALSGVAVLNGLVIITFIEQLRAEGRSVRRGGARRRADPAAPGADDGAGRQPRLRADGARDRRRRRGAAAAGTVVIGGIISSTVLTLLVLPALYTLFRRDAVAADVLPQTALGERS